MTDKGNASISSIAPWLGGGRGFPPRGPRSLRAFCCVWVQLFEKVCRDSTAILDGLYGFEVWGLAFKALGLDFRF